MSKRKLSDQQSRRIKANQQELLEAPQVFDELTHSSALVIANRGQLVEILTQDELVHQCLSRQNLGALVPGDQVMIEFPEGPDSYAIIKAVHPRRTELVRPDRYKQRKCIAANIDLMIIVVADEPECIPYFIDKYLVAAELSGFQAMIAMNKIDTLSPEKRAALAHKVALFPALGVPVVAVSAKSQEGIPQLLELMRDRQSIVVGQSGVGKSSLVNALLGTQVAEEGLMSEANQKGRHTTTTAKLYMLPGKANLIDSPGIREFGLWHLEAEEILKGFKEFKPYLNCHFRNCTHREEPGCGLLHAIKQGLISAQRLQHFHRMVRERE